jgi:hypothetical protein
MFSRFIYVVAPIDTSFLFFFFFPLAVLWFEIRVLYLLGNCFATWATSPALFALCYFLDMRPCSSYLCFPCSWDCRYVPPILLVEMGFLVTFCLDWPWTIIFPMSTSNVAGIIGRSHHAWLPYCALWLSKFPYYEQTTFKKIYLALYKHLHLIFPKRQRNDS